MTTEKKPNKPNSQQPSFDPRKVVWTNDKADELWKRMMNGGKDLTSGIRLPFTPQNPEKQ